MTDSTHAGVWRLQGAEEFRSTPYNRPGTGRLADADPYCRGHTIDIGGGRDQQSFMVRNYIPGDCHNRNGVRGLEEIKYEWTAPPPVLVPGQPLAIRLRSTVATLQSIGPGWTEGLFVAGFVPFESPNVYGERGGAEPDRSTTVAVVSVKGAAGATASDDGLRPAQRAEPLRVPQAPWLASERFDGRVRLRLFTFHGGGPWASVDYVYRWDASAETSTQAPQQAPTSSAAPTPSPAGARSLELGSQWQQSENGWAGTWTRRGTSNIFDAVWVKDGARVTATLTITPMGARAVYIHRRDTSGSNLEIEYVGLIDAQGQVQGVGLVLGQNWRYTWTAAIRR